MKSKSYVPILLVVILIFGCATPRMYEGQRLPQEQVATVRQKLFHATGMTVLTLMYYSDIRFEAIDGRSVNFIERVSGIEVLPGWHEVIVWVSKRVFLVGYGGDTLDIYKRKQLVRLRFCAKADHKYLVKGSVLWTKHIKIVDVDSGEQLSIEPVF